VRIYFSKKSGNKNIDSTKTCSVLHMFSSLNNDENTIPMIHPFSFNIQNEFRYYFFWMNCRNPSLRKGIKFITIRTTHHLLARSKHTICCCYHYPSNTAITLESIHRIDEYHARPNTPLYLVLWIFCLLVGIAGVLVSIFLAYDANVRLIGIIVSTIPLIIISLTIFSCSCYCFKRRVIQLTGSFGSIKILFEKKQARFFQINLSKTTSSSNINISAYLLSW
jgi:hypothetical protein